MKNLLAYPPTQFWQRLAVAGLLGAALASGVRAQTTTLYNGPGGILAVADSVLYARGDAASATAVAFQNQGSFSLSATAPARPRLFLDEGDLLNGGSFTAGISTVVMNGASGYTRNLTLGTGSPLYNLRIDNPVANSRSGGVQLGSSGVVTKALRMANGYLFTTINFQLQLDPAARVQGENDNSYVKGSLIQTQHLSGGGTTTSDFGNMGFTLNATGFSQGFDMTVDRRAGVNVLNYSYGQNPTVPGFKGIDRIWRVTSNAAFPTTAVTINLNWLQPDDHGNDFSASMAQVWYSTDQGGTWKAIGPPQTANNRNVSFGTYLLTGVWYTVSSTPNPLPVELTAFTATAQQLDVALAWSTASEQNSDYFAIERSANGQTWQDVGRQAAAGQSSRPRNYAILDRNAGRVADLLYYRLRQVDLNGTAHYSPVRTVRFAREALGFALDAFPVPLQATLTLDVRCPGPEPLVVDLYDVSGRVLLHREWPAPAATARYALDVQTLASGSYLLRARQGSAQATRKLVKE